MEIIDILISFLYFLFIYIIFSSSLYTVFTAVIMQISPM